MKARLAVFLLLFSLSSSVFAQTLLKPGFDVGEYLDLLGIAGREYDTLTAKQLTPLVANYQLKFRSPQVGLFNQWSLWLRSDRVGIISLRGTTSDTPSWIENFYAAMVPATGSLTLNDSTTFTYQLAADPKAAVHVGWLLGLGHLAPTILTQIRTQHADGIREFLIMGHSQGGALAYLLRSYLHYLVQKGELPNDLIFKTYCSAAPKPGNLFYAYDFDYITRNGWQFTVLNAVDWVPETPFSLQTLQDFNPTNPFRNVKGQLRKQPLLVRLYAGNIYRKLNGRSQKSERTFEKYLGKKVSLLVRKTLPQFKPPQYAPTSNFMRAGVPIVLQPDDIYRKEFPDEEGQIFKHHVLKPYYTLAQRIYQSTK